MKNQSNEVIFSSCEAKLLHLTIARTWEKSISESTLNLILIPMRYMDEETKEEYSQEIIPILESAKTDEEIKAKLKKVAPIRKSKAPFEADEHTTLKS